MKIENLKVLQRCNYKNKPWEVSDCHLAKKEKQIQVLNDHMAPFSFTIKYTKRANDSDSKVENIISRQYEHSQMRLVREDEDLKDSNPKLPNASASLNIPDQSVIVYNAIWL